MEPNKPYGISPIEEGPIDPDRAFSRQTRNSGYEAGIAGSEGRKFTQDPYAAGDDRLKARRRAEEALDWGGKIGSRGTTRNTRTDMNWAIAPSGGGIGG